MNKKYYIFTAVISYLIILIATVPAASVSRLINDNSMIKLQGVSGTLWTGHAHSTIINDEVRLDNTHWSITLWSLLLGEISVDIDTELLGNRINAELGSTLFGRIFVNDLHARLPAEDISQLAQIPLAQISGTITVDIEHAQWKPDELPGANGKIVWQDAEITVAETASLGNVNILLSETGQQPLFAELSNQGGDIRVAGNAALIPQANYTVDVRLSPTETASDNIKQSLGLFAVKQSNGEYLLKKTGPLNQLGFM